MTFPNFNPEEPAPVDAYNPTDIGVAPQPDEPPPPPSTNEVLRSALIEMLGDDQLFLLTAELNKKLVGAHERAGFSREEAIQIVSRQGVSNL